MKKLFFITITVIALFLIGKANALPPAIIIDGVPSYNRYIGCSPTAAAMILGYWDQWYEDLFSSEIWQTPYDEIAMLANDMNTGDGLPAGYTYVHEVDDGVRKFTRRQGYDFDSEYLALDWDFFTDEIDAGYPVKLGLPGHAIVGFGYEETDDRLLIAGYNGYHEDETIDWFDWRDITNLMYVHPMGVLASVAETFVPPTVTQTPEPATLILVGVGIAGLFGFKRKKGGDAL